jgi:class 3 adenylate cyclase
MSETPKIAGSAGRMTAARRLAAILAADVVGYSRLMGEDEAAAAKAALAEARRLIPQSRSNG